MKKTRLFEFMKNKRFELTDAEFEASAEPNPFVKSRKTVVVDTDDGMSGYVRRRGDNQGLDKVSRAHTGQHSGVNSSKYDDLVRRISDLDDMISAELDMQADLDYDEKYRTHKDEEDYYLNTKDRSYRKNEFNDDEDVNDIDADAGWAFMRQLSDEDDMGFESDDMDMEVEFPDGMDADSDGEEFDDLEGPDESPYEGMVRAIKGAYLVSKKKQPDETFTEVWMYNVGKKNDDEANIRKSILSGTDIDPTKNFSEDGSQEAVIKSVGNVQFLTLVGLPD
jgi:hypothetical protein